MRDFIKDSLVWSGDVFGVRVWRWLLPLFFVLSDLELFHLIYL